MAAIGVGPAAAPPCTTSAIAKEDEAVTQSEPPAPNPTAPRDGASAALGAAILRVSATLDLDDVLREVIESARALTGARLGSIVVVDEAGAPTRYHFSGLEPGEDERLVTWPDGLRLFEHLRGLPGPLRLADLAGYARGLGMEPTAAFSRTFQGTPMRHGGVDAGIFFLAEKADGREFDDADEAVLSVFAAQAAAAVANARAHGAERRARADLEALVETSPVGVVRFDAATGELLSLNREGRRMVEGLRTPGHPAEQLLEVISCRRADGREWSLAEFPLARQFANAETVRAEEVVLSVPDGRSVRALVNVTPVPAADDGAGSVVVTLQDLAPLDEIDRMRTEFLALVGHELRQPLVAIKGSAAALLEAEEGLDPAEAREFHRIIAHQADHMRGLVADLLDAGRIGAGTLSVTPEPTDVATLVERARTAFLGGGAGHAVQVDLPANLPPAMADRRRVAQVLANLLANAARHSPPEAPIRITAARDGGHVAVSVADRGRGIAPERLPHLFRTHGGDADTAGHGLGLAVSKGLVEAHGGRIRAESDGPGKGAVITFTLPAASGAVERRRAADAPDAGERAGARPRVLVVDDDPNTLRLVRDALAAAGFAPAVTSGEGDLGQIVRREKPQLILLDLMLPGADGIELLRTLPELADVPVIFISGYGRDETVARALEAGAADYLVKPFSPTELTARVRAALRRADDPETFRHGDLEIDYARRRASVAGREVELTATEFDLLRLLSVNAGRVVGSDVLLRRIWPDRRREGTNVVRTFVGTLRQKLGDDAANPAWIFNERGVGYRMPKPGDA